MLVITVNVILNIFNIKFCQIAKAMSKYWEKKKKNEQLENENKPNYGPVNSSFGLNTLANMYLSSSFLLHFIKHC